jgi:hypothetical protein
MFRPCEIVIEAGRFAASESERLLGAGGKVY